MQIDMLEGYCVCERDAVSEGMAYFAAVTGNCRRVLIAQMICINSIESVLDNFTNSRGD